MATLSVESTVGPGVTNSKRKRKKGRIIQKGYHKSGREDARRVAAKAFLSGILLDTYIQPKLQLNDLAELSESQEATDGSVSRPISSASRYSNAVLITAGSDEANITTDLISGEGRLYELALDSLPQLQHHSPYKSAPFKSTDGSLGSPSPAKQATFNHSVSVFETQAERRNIFNASSKKWQSLDSSSAAVYSLNTLSGVQAEMLLDSRSDLIVYS